MRAAAAVAFLPTGQVGRVGSEAVVTEPATGLLLMELTVLAAVVAVMVLTAQTSQATAATALSSSATQHRSLR